MFFKRLWRGLKKFTVKKVGPVLKGIMLDYLKEKEKPGSQ